MRIPEATVQGDNLWSSCLSRVPKGVVISVCAEAGLSEDDIKKVLEEHDNQLRYPMYSIDGKKLNPRDHAVKIEETRLLNLENARAKGKLPVLTGFSVFFAFIGLALIDLHDFWWAVIFASVGIAAIFDHFD